MLARLLQKARNRPDLDPGLGTKVVARHSRMILADGSFHIRRVGMAWWRRSSPYQWLGQISWLSFTLLAFAGYFVANTLFALAYLCVGVEHLSGIVPGSWGHDFREAWFFSAQTLTTVGYGHVSPSGSLVSSIAAFEALFGLMGFGVWTGLLFNRFSRARSRILFSQHAVVAPHKDATAWMFRMVASHDHPLLDAEAYALFSWIGEGATGPVRHYQDMALERSTVRFFPMNWTVVHPINDDSPLKDLSKADLEQVDAEILVLVRAHDESYGQSVHARASWKASDILFDERFSPMMSPGHDGATEIDLSKLNSTEKVG